MAESCLSPLNQEARFERGIQRSPFSYFYKNVIYEVEISGRKGEITKEFVDLGDDRGQFDFVWKIAPHWGESFPFKRKGIKKSFKEAIAMKDEGNRLFAEKEYQKANNTYSRALLIAPWDEVQDGVNALAACFANRSAVLFAQRQYISALKDCRRALDHGYNPSQRHRLLHRLAKIHLELKKMPAKGVEYAEKSISELNAQLAKIDASTGEGGQNEKSRENYVELKEKYETTKRQLARLLEQDGAGAAGDITMTEDQLLKHVPFDPYGYYVKNDCHMYDKVSGQLSTIFPSASNKIQLHFDDKYGRHFRAVTDIKPGEVLVMEKPYASVLLPEHTLRYCLHCFDVCDTPVPCQACCSVMFCSEQCREKAADAHRYECPLMDLLYDEEIGTAAYLAVRMIFKKSPQEWMEFADTPVGKEGFRSDNFHGITGWTYKSDDYDNVFSLVKNTSLRRPPELFHLATIAVYLVRLLENLDERYMPRDWPEPDRNRLRNILGGVLFHHLQNLPCNAHVLSDPGEPEKDPDLLEEAPLKELKTGSKSGKNSFVLGTGVVNLEKDPKVAKAVAVYPTLSLVNHSCDPNCVRIDLGTRSVLRAIRFIPRGKQVTCSYGPHYAKKNRLLRREELKLRFLFKCECKACHEDWPNFESLLEKRERFKCPHCDAPYVRRQGRDCDDDQYYDTYDFYDYVCASCKKDFSETVKQYEVGQREYTKHFAAVLSGKPERGNGRFLERHIETLESLLMRPSGEFHDCFITLCQYYTGVDETKS